MGGNDDYELRRFGVLLSTNGRNLMEIQYKRPTYLSTDFLNLEMTSRLLRPNYVHKIRRAGTVLNAFQELKVLNVFQDLKVLNVFQELKVLKSANNYYRCSYFSVIRCLQNFAKFQTNNNVNAIWN